MSASATTLIVTKSHDSKDAIGNTAFLDHAPEPPRPMICGFCSLTLNVPTGSCKKYRYSVRDTAVRLVEQNEAVLAVSCERRA